MVSKLLFPALEPPPRTPPGSSHPDPPAKLFVDTDFRP